MKNVEKEKLYAIIAACCFAVLGICAFIGICKAVNFAEDNRRYYPNLIYHFAYLVATVGMATALFLKNKYIALAASVAMEAFMYLFLETSYKDNYYLPEPIEALVNNYCSDFIVSIDDNTFARFSFGFGILDVIVYVLLAVAFLLVINKKTTAKAICFLPCAISLLSFVDGIIKNGAYFGVISRILQVVGLVFIGLWLKENMENQVDKQMAEPVANNITEDERIKKLKELKNLLDSDIITPEEFDTKKKEVLEK